MSRPDTSAQAVARRLVVAFVILIILFSIGMLTARAKIDAAENAPAHAPSREPTALQPLGSGWRQTPSIESLGALRSGLATWYCCTRGYSSSAYVAAAGLALRVGHWRGRYVLVSSGLRHIRVRLVDYCDCRSGVVVDLHPAAFRALAPLSRGVVKVRVTW